MIINPSRAYHRDIIVHTTAVSPRQAHEHRIYRIPHKCNWRPPEHLPDVPSPSFAFLLARNVLLRETHVSGVPWLRIGQPNSR
jgi:hypothetical protein